MAFVHKDHDAVDFKFHVVIALPIKSKDIAHARTAATLYSNSQLVAFRDVFGRHNIADFQSSSLSQLDRALQRCRTHESSLI